LQARWVVLIKPLPKQNSPSDPLRYRIWVF